MTARPKRAIKRLFAANRGEVAVRIIRAWQKLGLEAVVAVSDADRETPAAKMADALGEFRVTGLPTTIPLHQAILRHPEFVRNRVTTRWVEQE